MKFNKPQQRAVLHKDGPMMVLAGPGSGKTTVILGRIRHLIIDCGIPPESILVVTFSRAAAEEMSTRFADSFSNVPPPVFGTFHGIFLQILKEYGGYSSAGIITDQKKTELIRTAVEKHSVEYDDAPAFFKDIVNEISKVRSNPDLRLNYAPKSLPVDIFDEVLSDYERSLSRGKLLDYDDMLISCYNLLSRQKDVLYKVRLKYRYILIDEFQDINALQYDIIKMIAAPQNNLFVVGDDDQSIYAFRGARPEIMQSFFTDYPNAEQTLLNINYRSTGNILSAANRLINENKKRFSKKLIAAGEQGIPESVVIEGFAEREDEYEKMILEIRRFAEEDGFSYSMCAALFRNNEDSTLFREMLTLAGIPFSFKGKSESIFSHFIFRDVVTYIKIANGLSAGHADMLRIINRPSRYIARESLMFAGDIDSCIKAMRAFYKDNRRILQNIAEFERHLKALSGMPPFAAFQYILNVIGYRNHLITEYGTTMDMVAEKLDEITVIFKRAATINDLLRIIDADTTDKNASESEKDSVQILTMHAAKGLEFPVVFIPDVNDSIIPNKKNVSAGAIEEERRLLYVAMTRAQKYLRISYVGRLHNKKAAPSRFLDCLL